MPHAPGPRWIVLNAVNLPTHHIHLLLVDPQAGQLQVNRRQRSADRARSTLPDPAAAQSISLKAQPSARPRGRDHHSLQLPVQQSCMPGRRTSCFPCASGTAAACTHCHDKSARNGWLSDRHRSRHAHSELRHFLLHFSASVLSSPNIFASFRSNIVVGCIIPAQGPN